MDPNATKDYGRVCPYMLSLTEEDVRTIAFVGDRYCWSAAMLMLAVGDNLLTEPEAWELAEAIEADAEGGHSILPMLSPNSTLGSKIITLLERIV